MKLKTSDIILLVLLGVIVLAIIMGCTFSCKEGFLSQFGDQIHDPFLPDFANLPATSDPTRLRWQATKEEVPVQDATHEYPYTGLSGDIHRPIADNGYYSVPCHQREAMGMY